MTRLGVAKKDEEGAETQDHTLGLLEWDHQKVS